jgi:hypothetical protein
MNIVQPPRPAHRRKRRTAVSSAGGVKRGLPARKVDDYLRFMLFLALIGVGYIWNSYLAERQIKEMEEVRQEVKRLKSRYLLKESMFSAGTRLSQIESQVDSLGLRLPEAPPQELVRGATLPPAMAQKVVRNPERRFDAVKPPIVEVPTKLPETEVVVPSPTVRQGVAASLQVVAPALVSKMSLND